MVSVPAVGCSVLVRVPVNNTSAAPPPTTPRVPVLVKFTALLPTPLCDTSDSLRPFPSVSPFTTLKVELTGTLKSVSRIAVSSVTVDPLPIVTPAIVRLIIAFLMIAPLASVAVLVPPMASVPPESAICDEIVVVPAPPGLMFRLSRSPPATLSVMAPLMTTLRLAFKVRVLVPTVS